MKRVEIHARHGAIDLFYDPFSWNVPWPHEVWSKLYRGSLWEVRVVIFYWPCAPSEIEAWSRSLVLEFAKDWKGFRDNRVRQIVDWDLHHGRSYLIHEGAVRQREITVLSPDDS